jgi:hypothetical protein
VSLYQKRSSVLEEEVKVFLYQESSVFVSEEKCLCITRVASLKTVIWCPL